MSYCQHTYSDSYHVQLYEVVRLTVRDKHGSARRGGDLLSLRTDAPAGPTYPLDGANSPPTWTIVFYLLRKGVKPPVLVLCLAFRHRKVQLY